MSWTDIVQFVLLVILFVLLMVFVRLSVPNTSTNNNLNLRRLDKLWNHFYTYEVTQHHRRYMIRRKNTIDNTSHVSGYWLTYAEAEARMKNPSQLTDWQDDVY